MTPGKQNAVNLMREAIKELEKEELTYVPDQFHGPGVSSIINNTNSGNTNGSDGVVETLRDKVVNTAKKYLGGKYLYGGKDMTKIFEKGVDCSGFTQGVYRECGINVPKYAVGSNDQRQWGKATTDPKPGDLVCYSGHVAIYIGNGEIVNCGSTPIKILRADYRSIICYRDLIGG